MKQRQTRIKIPFLLNSQGEDMTNPMDIANTFASFYAKLYNLQESENITPPCPDKFDAFLSSIPLPSLSPHTTNILNDPLHPRWGSQDYQIPPIALSPWARRVPQWILLAS